MNDRQPTSSTMLDTAPGYGDDGLRGKTGVSSLDQQYTDETLRVFSPSSQVECRAARGSHIRDGEIQISLPPVLRTVPFLALSADGRLGSAGSGKR